MLNPANVVWFQGFCFIRNLCSWEETPKKIKPCEGWCSLGWVQSQGDFEGLDPPRSWFLRPQAHCTSYYTNRPTNKKYHL